MTRRRFQCPSSFALLTVFTLIVPSAGVSLWGCEGGSGVTANVTGDLNTTGGDPADGDGDNNTSGDPNVPGGTSDNSSNDSGGNTSGDTSGGDTPALPQNEYCAAVEEWDAGWVQFERDVLDLINQRRAEGADCGSNGTFAPAGPLTMNGALQCAARNHSMDMAERGFFSHTNPDGDGPGERLDAAGYDASTWGENIAYGYPTPEAVVDGWMNSDGHCANIMNPSFTEIGVGYYGGNYWTLDFGKPR